MLTNVTFLLTFHLLMKFLKTATLLSILFLSLTGYAQILNRQQSQSGQQEGTEGDQDTKAKEKDNSAISPDTARVQIYTLNMQAAYTLLPFKAPLHNFQDYDPVQKAGNMYATLGNAGTASLPLTYRLHADPGFTYSYGVFALYQINQDSIRYMLPEKPFSELRYVMGKAKEQQLTIVHSQQVRKGLTIGLNARFANSPGLYLRQKSHFASGYFTVHYVLPSNRYGVFTSYMTDKFYTYENGGILYDSVFKDNTSSKRQEVLVHLSNSINRTKNTGIVLQQYINIQKQKSKSVDSTDLLTRTRRFDAGRFIHTFKYSRLTSAFQDDDQSHAGINYRIYPVTYGDSIHTLDSIYHIHIENNLVYSNIEPDTATSSTPIQYSFGISQHFDKIGYGNLVSQANFQDPASIFSRTQIVSSSSKQEQYTQIIPFGTLKGIIARKTYFLANGRLSIGGYNSGDYELSGSFYQHFGPKGNAGRIFLVATKGLTHPDYFFNRYISNHFRWDNSLKPQDYELGTAGIDLLGYYIAVNFTRITNYTFLNSSMQPEQSVGGLTITRADASKIFRPGKWIIDTRFTYQKVSHSGVLQLPELVARASVSYNLLLFNNVLHAQVGISTQYNSAYYADAYNPALRMFYRQDSLLTGNYPFCDAFINMRVKRARIFFKYQHFNAGWFGYNYEMIPGYPGADAALKVGVSWVFYD